MDAVVQYHGVPRCVRSDNASVFTSEFINKLYSLFAIKASPSTSYHHQTIGFIERWHSTLKRMLLCHQAAGAPIVLRTLLPLLVLAFNTTTNLAIGYAPSFINRLRHLRLPVDTLSEPPRDGSGDPAKLPEWLSSYFVAKGIVHDVVSQTLGSNSLSRKKILDLKRDVVLRYRPGDRVLLIKGTVVDKNIPKAEEPTTGPYTVDREVGQGRYKLRDLQSRRIHQEVHIDRLLPYPSRVTRSESDRISMWSVNRVVGRRLTSTADSAVGRVAGDPSVMEYKLRWSGFGSQYDQWRSNHYLDDIAELVAAYNAKHPLPAEHASLVLAPEVIDDPAGQPPPSPAALARRHFRSRPPTPSASTTVEPLMTTPAVAPAVTPDVEYLSTPADTATSTSVTQVSPVQPSVSAPIVEGKITIPAIDATSRRHSPRLPVRPLDTSVADGATKVTGDTTDSFPVSTRVEVQWPCGGWFSGIVISSFISRTRRPARVLKVRYDDSPAQSFTHTLTGAFHLFRVEQPRCSTRLRETAVAGAHSA